MNWIATITTIKKLLRNPLFAVPIVAILLALTLASILYFTNNTELSNFLIITILAFLASDLLTWGLIGGGKGIFQFSPIGTKAQPKGYAFIIFFIVIIVVAYVVNLGTQWIINFVSSFYSDFIKVLGTCLILAILVYLDMYIKFFVHPKK